ncbi:MAG TPA: hemolysin, partial [Hyalangium sp.]|nr:hemolysin [Hyalangium sp.]
MGYGRGIHERTDGADSRRKRIFAALVALALAGACDTTGSEDAERARNTRNLDDVCEVRPPYTPHFQPELQWAWTGSSILPEFNQVMMTPAVADVNQ